MFFIIETATIFLVLASAAFLILCFYLSGKVTHPEIKRLEYTRQWEIDHGTECDGLLERLRKEEIFIPSPYGYRIHGLFFPKAASNKAVILCHGITWNLYGSLKYVEMFLKKGFSVLVYDHRNHGLSGGKDTSFGYYEKFDLKTCTDWVLNRLGENTIIGLLGESMGAGTVLQNLAIDPRVKFCIADCAYSDIVTLFKYQLAKRYKIKRLPIVKVTSYINKLRRGWKFEDISPIKAISKVVTPVLFTHGGCDELIPNWMSKEMHRVKEGYKDLYIAPEAAHVETYYKDAREYENKLDKFLKNIGIL